MNAFGKLKVGSQPPAPFMEPFVKTASQTGRISQKYFDTLQDILRQESIEISAIYVKRIAASRVQVKFPLRICANDDKILMGNDVVFELLEE